MSGRVLIDKALCVFLLGVLLACVGCATAPDATVPPENRGQSIPVPAATRFLGQATVYISAAGESVEVVRDASAGNAIVKLPDGSLILLPEEIAGIEGRYRNKQMMVWENGSFVLLWIEGKLLFRGKSVE